MTPCHLISLEEGIWKEKTAFNNFMGPPKSKKTHKNLLCDYSCFLLHNETVNIWSHLLGFATFLYCLAALIVNPPQGARSFIDLLPLYTQLITYQVRSKHNAATNCVLEKRELKMCLVLSENSF